MKLRSIYRTKEFGWYHVSVYSRPYLRGRRVFCWDKEKLRRLVTSDKHWKDIDGSRFRLPRWTEVLEQVGAEARQRKAEATG